MAPAGCASGPGPTAWCHLIRRTGHARNRRREAARTSRPNPGRHFEGSGPAPGAADRGCRNRVAGVPGAERRPWRAWRFLPCRLPGDATGTRSASPGGPCPEFAIGPGVPWRRRHGRLHRYQPAVHPVSPGPGPSVWHLCQTPVCNHWPFVPMAIRQEATSTERSSRRMQIVQIRDGIVSQVVQEPDVLRGNRGVTLAMVCRASWALEENPHGGDGGRIGLRGLKTPHRVLQ